MYRLIKLQQQFWRFPVQECKSSWIRLRNCFVNAIKRRHILKHGKKRRLAPWKYEDKMSFLLPFIENRGSLVNYNRLREELLGNPSGDDQHEDSQEVEQLPLQRTKEIQLVYGNESDLDESDLFYLSMSRIAKRLPKMEQAKLRLKICTIVSEFEMDVIENQEGISMSFVDDASNLIAVKTEIDSDICTRTGEMY